MPECLQPGCPANSFETIPKHPVENLGESASGSLGTLSRNALLPIVRIRSTVSRSVKKFRDFPVDSGDRARESAKLGAALGVKLFAKRSEEHTSELQSLMRISYAVCCLNKTQTQINTTFGTHIICPNKH